MKRKVNVLVTGAGGQLGLTLKDISEAYQEIDFYFFNSSNLDITNQTILRKALEQNNYHYCINCAAYTNVEKAEAEPEVAFKVNAEAVKTLSKICKENKITLIHISTDYVFDGEKSKPYTVNDKTNPINQYGKSKLLGEQHIRKILKQYFIIRTSWLYSKKHGQNFYKKILEKGKTQKQIEVTDKQTGCPTDTVNLSKFIISLILEQNTSFGILHFCDNRALSWYDFAKEILRENNLLDQISLVKAVNYSTFVRRPKNSILLTSTQQKHV